LTAVIRAEILRLRHRVAKPALDTGLDVEGLVRLGVDGILKENAKLPTTRVALSILRVVAQGFHRNIRAVPSRSPSLTVPRLKAIKMKRSALIMRDFVDFPFKNDECLR
jgi:hypothetical protein